MASSGTSEHLRERGAWSEGKGGRGKNASSLASNQARLEVTKLPSSLHSVEPEATQPLPRLRRPRRRSRADSPPTPPPVLKWAQKWRRVAAARSLAADRAKYCQEDLPYNGGFIDHLIRARTGPQEERAAARWLLDPPRRYRSKHPKAVAELLDGIEFVVFEKLLTELSHIVVSSKGFNCGGPPLSGLDRWRAHCQRLVLFSRQASALRAEVEHWARGYRREVARRQDKEDAISRTRRLAGFWPHFHTYRKMDDKQPDKMIKRQASVRRHMSYRQQATMDSLGSLSEQSDSEAEDPDTPYMSVPRLALSSFPGGPWKLRAARHQCVPLTPMRSTGAASIGGFDTSPKALGSWGLSDLSEHLMTSTAGFSATYGSLSDSQRTGSPPMCLSKSDGFMGFSPTSSGWTKGDSPSRRLHEGEELQEDPQEDGHSSGESAADVVPARVQKAFTDSSTAFRPRPKPGGTLNRYGIQRPRGRQALNGTGRKASAASMPSLPRMAPKASEKLEEASHFWMPYVRRHKINDTQSFTPPTHLYLRACDTNHVLPRLMPFCTGDSTKLDAANQGMSDHNLSAVTEMFRHIRSVREVDLKGNNLTERSLTPFLQKLFGVCADQCLERLSLRHCTRHATGTGVHEMMDCMVDLLERGVHQLKVLDLSGIRMVSHLPLCQAIREHQTLTVVGLAEVGLGKNPRVLQCLTNLLASKTVADLDLGWNHFGVDAFAHLGACLVESPVVHTLSLANCAAAKGADNPVEHFLECLAFDSSLMRLDISLNRIDFRGALILEAALERNDQLVDIDISNNPLDVLGFRSSLRVLSRDTSGLVRLQCQSCSTGGAAAPSEDVPIFNPTNPGGRYSLELSRPYDRALLRMLYITADRLGLAPEQAFTVLAAPASKRRFQHPSRSPCGGWEVPSSGRMEVNFSVDAALERATAGIADADLSGFLAKHYELVRVTPSVRKRIVLLAQWQMLEGCEAEQHATLDALSKDFVLTYPMFRQISCRSRELAGDIAWRLLPCVVGGGPMRFLSMLQMPSIAVYLDVLRRGRRFLVFNVESPTGHYTLDLSNCCDFAVGEQLLLLDRWETSIAKRRDLANTSQRGFRSQLRNELYQGRELSGVESVADFKLPAYGMFEFDYISSIRPPKNAAPIEDAALTSMLIALQQARCSQLNQIDAVAMIAHYFYMSSMQMRALTGIFRETYIRAEFFVRFFLRLTDVHNEKVFRARFDDDAEFVRLQSRLGHTTFFPFMQPEQAYFELDFAVHDQRLAAYILLSLAAKEVRNNVYNCSYTLADGTVDRESLSQGVPKNWEALEGIPTSGVFRCRYICSPQDRNFKERQRLMETFGFWTPPEEEEVIWWSSIKDCPGDVFEFVEFLYANFPQDPVWASFRILSSGKSSNGSITLHQFEKRWEELKWGKISKKDKQERIKSIFRYLDPNGDGNLSETEWGVLEQLFQEIQLSSEEFVNFCQRTFGEDLHLAWRALDKDGNGEIDKEEWQWACQRQGFFGPTLPIFKFLDTDDTGILSLEKFMRLKPVEGQQEQRRRKSLEGVAHF